LQNPPEEIPKIVRRFEKGYDVVCGVRKKRSESFLRRKGALFYAFLIRYFLNLKNPDPVTQLRIISSRVAKELLSIKEQSCYIDALMTWMGYKSSYVEVEYNKRKRGETHYSYWDLFMMTVELILGFSPKILRFITVVGLVISSVSFLYGFSFFVRRILGESIVAGYTSLIVVITFLFGLMFIFMGIIGEYIARLFTSSLGRPYYIIDEIFTQKNINQELYKKTDRKLHTTFDQSFN